MYRNTYVEVNLSNLENNVKKIINKLNDYKYYFGVVKADCYGHNDYKSVEAIINGGCNYLVVATLEEALFIRNYNKDIPILCLGIINCNDLELCYLNNITITINSLEYTKEVINSFNNTLKVHIKINTGMNRLGVKNKDEFNNIVSLINDSNLYLEGLYTHIYSPDIYDLTMKQYDCFKYMVSDIDISKIDIIHLSASLASLYYSKLDIANGTRLGISMYGLIDNDLDLDSTFSLYSEVIQINELCNETLGYDGNYYADGNKRIAVVPIGYADGIIRKNTGRYVYINDKRYDIVGNICMDMLFVLIDEDVKIHDKVVLIKDNEHIDYIANYLDTINYEVICSIGKRVPRVYVK